MGGGGLSNLSNLRMRNISLPNALAQCYLQRASALSLTRRYAFANGPIRTPYPSVAWNNDIHVVVNNSYDVQIMIFYGKVDYVSLFRNHIDLK